MKQLKYFLVFISILFLSHKGFAWSNIPVISEVISTEYMSITGTFEFQIKYKFLDTVTYSSNANVELPYGWTASFNPTLANNTYNRNDSIFVTITVSYPMNNIPYFVQNIRFSHYLDSSYSNIEIFQSAMIYFTPYNTIEIWNLSDFTNLTRRWLLPDEVNDTTRFYINKNYIPISNIDTETAINWKDSTRAWDNDWLDNFREKLIPGLAYSVLLAPIPPDSIDYYNEMADTNSLKSTFSGNVNGYLRANFKNDLDQPSTIPLAGIRVKLMQHKCFLGVCWWSELDEGYTDEDGYFSLNYNTQSSGNEIKLGLQFISNSDNEFDILSTNLWGNRFKHTLSWYVSQTANTIYNYTFTEFEYPSEAIKTVHWARRGFQYFKNHNIQPFDKKLRIRSYADDSFFDIWISAQKPAIHIASGYGRREATTYHEFGHVVMYKLQNNTFTIPFGEQGVIPHYWAHENTSRLAWVEGWANAIEMILDAVYWLEDGEYGLDYGKNRPYYEVREHWSWGESFGFQYINNGYRSEYYIACAIYDLWDGPGKGLPEQIPNNPSHPLYTFVTHGWNDTGQGIRGWKSIDDVELTFLDICKPLIDYNSDNIPWYEGGYLFREKCFNVQDYIFYLLENHHNNCKTKSDISRVFRENRVLLNIPEYEWNWNITNISSDKIRQSEQKQESGYAILGGVLNTKNWTDYYLVNYFNKNAMNNNQYLAYEYATGHPLPDDFKITDSYWLGVWDTYSNVFRRSDLSFNNEINSLGNFHHATYTTCGNTEMDVRYGKVTIGGGGATANIEITDGSILRFRGYGNINNLLINSDSELRIKTGGTLFIQSGSSAQLMSDSKIIVESGGYICIEDNVDLFLDGNSIIHLQSGAINGINPALNLNVPLSNCTNLNDIDYTGNGNIIVDNCSDFASYTDYTDVIINASVSWNNEQRKLKENLIVESIGVFNIDNLSKIEFAKDKKIIIKEGGKLIVNNSTITNLSECNEFWQGIEVWGDANASQFTQGAHGIVELKNGAVIENAMNGIRNHNPEDQDSRGGIIRCDGAVFKNNRRAVEFLEYRNFLPSNSTVRVSDRSYFKNTTFNVNEDYIGPNEFFAHVSMCNVQGVRFTECTFENNMENPQFSSNFYNNGIVSIDAGYTVNGRCDVNTLLGAPCPELDFHRSTFSGFNYAIKATSASTTSQLVNINGCSFTDNNFGVYVSGIQNFRCNRNLFYLGNSKDDNISDDFAIVSSNSTGYQIEENQIFSSPDPDHSTWGIIIKNSGPLSNLVYNNSFENINYALTSAGKNRDQGIASNNSGLKFLCNENNNSSFNIQDLFITGKSTSDGIAQYQGCHTLSAGNKFSESPANNTDGHIKNSVSHFSYYFTGDPVDTNPYYPFYFSGYLDRNAINLQFANPCLSHLELYNISDIFPLTPALKTQLSSEFDAAEMNFTNVLYTYNQLIDSGNTTALLNEIQNSWSQAAWDLRNYLLQFSPYLSQEAIIEAAFTGILPQAMLLEICLLNPEATRSEDFLKILTNEIQNPLPQYMIDMIIASWNLETSRSVIEASLSQSASKMDYISNLVISDLMIDSVSHFNDVIMWLNRRGTLHDYFLLAERYINAENFSAADSILSYIIPNQFDLTDEEKILYDDYVWYNEFRESVYAAGRTLSQLNENEIVSLEEFAAIKDNKISEYCKNILCFFYEICTPFETPLEIEPRKFRQPFSQSGSNQTTNYIRVYPNPANTYTTFEWTIPGNTNAIIRISTPTGIILKTYEFSSEKGQWLWDTRDVQSGVYMYELMKGNQRLESGRIGVVK